MSSAAAAPGKSCGDCSLCCKVMQIAAPGQAGVTRELTRSFKETPKGYGAPTRATKSGHDKLVVFCFARVTFFDSPHPATRIRSAEQHHGNFAGADHLRRRRADDEAANARMSVSAHHQ